MNFDKIQRISLCLLSSGFLAGFNVLGVLPATAADVLQIAKLSAADANVDDNFGYAVSLSGGSALIGAYQDDEFGANAGAEYIFRDDGLGNWTQAGKLRGNDTAAGDWFGYKVAIDGPLAVVGAIAENENGINAGAAYVFHDEGNGNWSQVAKLLPTAPHAGDIFGRSVAISGSTVLVGASADENFGAAYVFNDLGGGNWQEVQKLAPSVFDVNDDFGYSLALDGETAVISSGGGNFGSGAAYIFKKDGLGNFAEVDQLIPTEINGLDWFGFSVSISGSTAVVGNASRNATEPGTAYVYDDDGNGNWSVSAILATDGGSHTDSFGAAVAVDGDTTIVGARYSGDQHGTAYVYHRNPLDQWSQLDAIGPDDPQSLKRFGWTVAASDGNLLIGAPGDDNPNSDAGSAYVFRVPEPTTATLTIAVALSCMLLRRRPARG